MFFLRVNRQKYLCYNRDCDDDSPLMCLLCEANAEVAVLMPHLHSSTGGYTYRSGGDIHLILFLLKSPKSEFLGLFPSLLSFPNKQKHHCHRSETVRLSSQRWDKHTSVITAHCVVSGFMIEANLSVYPQQACCWSFIEDCSCFCPLSPPCKPGHTQ